MKKTRKAKGEYTKERKQRQLENQKAYKDLKAKGICFPKFRYIQFIKAQVATLKYEAKKEESELNEKEETR